jgi:hypothetical protein
MPFRTNLPSRIRLAVVGTLLLLSFLMQLA